MKHDGLQAYPGAAALDLPHHRRQRQKGVEFLVRALDSGASKCNDIFIVMSITPFVNALEQLT